jgi:hypothetical protein
VEVFVITPCNNNKPDGGRQMNSSGIRITRKHSGHNNNDNSKSTNHLLALKKTTQNFPLLQHTLLATERGSSLRETKSRGKLRMGSTSKPLLVLSKEQRKNPFHR